MSLTLFQLRRFGDELSDRLYRERRLQADLTRIAHNADRSAYERFLNSLKPEERQTSERPAAIPDGFAYRKEL